MKDLKMLKLNNQEETEMWFYFLFLRNLSLLFVIAVMPFKLINEENARETKNLQSVKKR